MLNGLSEFPEKLLSAERLKTDQRRPFVRAVVDEVRQTSKRLPKRQFEEIAPQIGRMYPDNFEDRIYQIRIGTGYHSLLNQLVTRNENLNRKYHPPKARSAYDSGTSKDNEQGKPTKKRKSLHNTDSYGCVSWGPQISEKEEEFKKH